MRDNNICILGMGYVGLTLAVVMAEKGFKVLGLEINPQTLNHLLDGKPHFHEVGLKVRLKAVLNNGSLKIKRTYEERDPGYEASVFIISVGTPLGKDKKPKMDMVQDVTAQIAEDMKEDTLIVLRSTVVLGTTRDIILPLLKRSGKKFDLAFCPERTLEGKALEEISQLPQIIGGLDEESSWRATQLFQRLTPTTIRVSDLESAEVVKLLDNSYRDLFFSFGNEVALMCDSLGLDGIEVIKAANTGYERTSIAMPGFVGGPCLEKDPHILEYSLQKQNLSTRLISTGRLLNEELPDRIIDMVFNELDINQIERPVVSICGLAFKGRPETSDTRGTPVGFLIENIKKKIPNALIRCHDYAVNDQEIKDEWGLQPVNIKEAFEGAHLVIISNNNAKYQWEDTTHLFKSMAKPGMVFDVWDVLSVGEHVEEIKYRRLGSAKKWSMTNSC